MPWSASFIQLAKDSLISTPEADADYFFSLSNQTSGQPLLMGSRISDLVI